MILVPNTSVRELALEIPGATRVFEKAGIDYCCGGQQSLAHACAREDGIKHYGRSRLGS